MNKYHRSTDNTITHGSRHMTIALILLILIIIEAVFIGLVWFRKDSPETSAQTNNIIVDSNNKNVGVFLQLDYSVIPNINHFLVYITSLDITIAMTSNCEFRTLHTIYFDNEDCTGQSMIKTSDGYSPNYVLMDANGNYYQFDGKNGQGIPLLSGFSKSSLNYQGACTAFSQTWTDSYVNYWRLQPLSSNPLLSLSLFPPCKIMYNV